MLLSQILKGILPFINCQLPADEQVFSKHFFLSVNILNGLGLASKIQLRKCRFKRFVRRQIINLD